MGAAIVLAARVGGERTGVGGGAGVGGGEEEWHSKGDGGGRFVAGSGRDGQHPQVLTWTAASADWHQLGSQQLGTRHNGADERRRCARFYHLGLVWFLADWPIPGLVPK